MQHRGSCSSGGGPCSSQTSHHKTVYCHLISATGLANDLQDFGFWEWKEGLFEARVPRGLGEARVPHGRARVPSGAARVPPSSECHTLVEGMP